MYRLNKITINIVQILVSFKALFKNILIFFYCWELFLHPILGMTSGSFKKCQQFLRNPDILDGDKFEKKLSVYLKFTLTIKAINNEAHFNAFFL